MVKVVTTITVDLDVWDKFKEIFPGKASSMINDWMKTQINNDNQLI